jgi:hypothetical protein
MSYVVNIPRLEDDGPPRVIELNLKVGDFDTGTFELEFNVAFKTFCVLVKRLFPELPINTVYDEETAYLKQRMDASRMTGGGFYYERAPYMFVRLLEKLHTLIESTESRLKTITRGVVSALFDKNSSNSLLMIAKSSDIHLAKMPFFRSRIYAGGQLDRLKKEVGVVKGNLHGVLFVLNLSNIVLHQIEHRLFSVISTRLSKEGPVADYPVIDFPRLVSSIGFWQPSMGRYVNDLNGLAHKSFQESIYMRTLLTPVEPAPPTSVNPLVLITLADVTYSLPRAAFEAHSIFIDEKAEVGRGNNSVLVNGCVVSKDCQVTIKITMYSYREALAQKAASRLGFAPALLATPFDVANIENDPANDKEDQYRFLVLVFDRLSYTFGEVLDREGMITKQDFVDIVDLLIRFEKANFVHHDLKPPNIMVKIDSRGNRRWYIIDVGTAWYGGRSYDPSAPEKNTSNNIPYGYDFEEKKVLTPNKEYLGWPRKLYVKRPQRFDLASLVASVVLGEYMEFDLFKLFMEQVNEHVEDILFVLDGNQYKTVFYRPYPESKREAFFAANTMAEHDLFLTDYREESGDDESSGEDQSFEEIGDDF